MGMVPQGILVPMNEIMLPNQPRTGNIAVNEIYLDGKLKKAELIDEDDKSYGIFMHSLILSNYAEVMKVSNSQVNITGDEVEKAIFNYTASKGFDKKLIENIAPKVDDLTFECENPIHVTTHLINDKMRIISKGTPQELLRRCTYILSDSKFVKLTRRMLREVNEVLQDMLLRCMSVYAIAIKDLSEIQEVLATDRYVSDMTLVALVGIGKA